MFAVPSPQKESRLSVFLHKAGHELGHQILGGHRGGADTQGLLITLRSTLLKGLRAAQDIPGGIVDLLPLLRQQHLAASASLDQAGVQYLLQGADMHADSGLGQMHGFRRLGKAAVLRRSHKGLQLSDADIEHMLLLFPAQEKTM